MTAGVKLMLRMCGLALLVFVITSCSNQPPSRLAQLSTTLASLPVINDQDTEPSRGARPALTTAKHQLRDIIEAALSDGFNPQFPDIAAKIGGPLKATGHSVPSAKYGRD